jgi:DNA recombination protein RmuC
MMTIDLGSILAVLLGVALCAVVILLIRNRNVGRELLGIEHELMLQTDIVNELKLREQSLHSDLAAAEQRLMDRREEGLRAQEQLDSQRLDVDRFRQQYFEAEKLADNYKVKWEESQARYDLLKSEKEGQQRNSMVVQLDYQKLLEEHSSLKASLEEREKSHQAQLSNFDEQKKQLEQSFQVLANRIFEEKGKHLSDNNKDSIEQLLKPFREQITEFRARVDGIHKENNEASGSLRKELEQLRELNQAMTTDAKNLTDALKGDKKKVGSWGEVQLEKTLQQAGLVKGDHYDTQVQFKDEHGKNNFPDFVVQLPDNKQIILDSKVSLVDYDAAISAETDEALGIALDRHVQAVKNHIDGLAAKDYSNLIGMKSPSFVLMFMPIEPAYIEAMKRSNDLFNYGYQKNVIMVSHTTLMPILRTVANLWMIERSNAEAKEISDRAGDVFNQVCSVAERLQKLGATLQTASKHYNSTVLAVAGQQGLHGKVERFNKLSSKVTKTMPELEPMHLDVESDRLEAIRIQEPVKSPVQGSIPAELDSAVQRKEIENEKEL